MQWKSKNITHTTNIDLQTITANLNGWTSLVAPPPPARKNLVIYQNSLWSGSLKYLRNHLLHRKTRCGGSWCEPLPKATKLPDTGSTVSQQSYKRFRRPLWNRWKQPTGRWESTGYKINPSPLNVIRISYWQDLFQSMERENEIPERPLLKGQSCWNRCACLNVGRTNGTRHKTWD